MKVLIIPDIHLKTWIFDRADKIIKDGRADQAVCLMDIPDDWNMEFRTECYQATLDRAILFAKDFPNTLWCYGNHDISYIWGKHESGYSTYAERIVISKMDELKGIMHNSSQLTFIHRIDNVIFSHGGLSSNYIRWLNKELLEAEIDEVINAVNNASQSQLWNSESPLWFRPQILKRKIFRNDIFKQVVGHTPVKKIYEQDGIISTDVFSTYRDGTQIGESAMIVIDTVTGKYEKIIVINKE